MGIVQLTTQLAAQVGISPRTIKMVTTDNLSTVTTAGYLNQYNLEGQTILPTDVFEIIYSYVAATNSGSFNVFLPSIVNGVITLSEYVSGGNVLLPVVNNDFPVFSGTLGQIKDSGLAPSSLVSQLFVVTTPGSLTPGNFPILNDAHGTLNTGLPPSAASQAFVVVSPGSLTSGNIASFSDVNGTLANGGVAANKVLTSAITTPDVSIDLVAFDVTVGQAALAVGGSVALYTSSGSKQYKIRNLWINSGGTNFSGGGGDRLGQITDGTTVYSVIPATNMQTLINAGWGISTPLPYPAAAAINTSTVAGASLVFKYSGGTTDYTAGSIVVSGILQRVA